MSSNNDDRDESQDVVVAGALRRAVATAFRDDRDAVTLRYIRTVVEKELGLGSEYFKLDPYWKDRSKEIVMQEVDIQSANHPEPSTQDEPPSSPPEKKKRGHKPAAKLAAKPRAKKAATPEPEDVNLEEDEEEEDVAPKARKRGAAKPSAEKKKPAAKRGKAKAKAKATVDKDDGEDDVEEDVPKSKVEAPATVDDESELSDIPDNFFTDESPKKRARKSDAEQVGSNKKLKSNSKASPKKVSPKKVSPKKVSPKKASPKKAKKVNPLEGKGEKDELVDGESSVAMGGQSGDESEMSVVLDEPPPEKKKKSRSRSTTTTTGDVTKKSKAAGKPKKEKAPGKDLSPDEEKIKSLQGWLLKCGVRKFWSKELAKYDSSKEKIKHLKGLLEEVGMTGQYSMAKAKKIKEDRELAAEVAWVQKGATDWGKETDEQVTTRAGKAAAASTSGRKLTQKSRGFEGLDFLDDQSDDDSD